MNEEFLTLEQFLAAREKVENSFHVERRLPEQLFKRLYKFQLLCEFDFAMSDILDALRETASPLQTETVLLSVLDPAPIDYFYKHYHKVNAFYFKANISKKEYMSLRWRDPGNQSDAIMFNSRVETYIPSSTSWAMWGERSREIAVIGLDDPTLAAYLINENGYWMDAETASNEFASMPYPHQKMPQDFKRALIANYGSRAGLEKKLGQRVKYPWEQEEAPSRD